MMRLKALSKDILTHLFLLSPKFTIFCVSYEIYKATNTQSKLKQSTVLHRHRFSSLLLNC